jgi:sulfite dehydrogenase (cytochrome) subunit B
MRTIAIALCGALVVTGAAAEEQPVTLKRTPGLELVEANCGACHSLDYIPMNSPFLNKAQWEAEVAKMIKMFGAPINEADATAIVDYLVTNYGE